MQYECTYVNIYNMRKFINIRLPVIIALALCSGIALGVILYYYKLSLGWIALALAPSAIIFGVLFLSKKKIIKPAVYVLLTLILFLGGALNSYYSLKRYSHTEIEAETEYYIHGTVTEKGTAANGEYIIIRNITVDGNKISGKVYVYLSDTYGELCDVGYKVDFRGTLEKFEPFQYGKLNSYAEENIKYRSSVFSGLQSTYGYSFFGSIRAGFGKTLFNNLNVESAAISYAMLTGNTKLAEAESIQSFRYGGVAHIFAVSGLHIGIIYTIISFILKKLRVRWYVSPIIIFSAVLFYTAICGFTLSAVRATIMCAVSLIAKLTFKHYDGLNSLALAVIIILSFSPLSLLSIGFQLSVCAVGGIYCLSKCIGNGLTKIKVPQSVSSAVGISVGAQLGTMPILLSSFGYVSGAGLLLNIVVLPVLSAMFVIIFLTTILCTVIPPISPFIIPYAALPLEFTISIFTGSGFEKALISGFGAGAFVPIYLVGILILSDKLNVKLLQRTIAFGCSIIILVGYVLLRNYSPFRGYKVIISAFNGGGEILIKSPQGNILIITDEVDAARLESMLNRNYCKDIDSVIIIGEGDLDAYARLNLDCDNIYVCNRFPQIQPYGDFIINYVNDFTAYGVSCMFLDQNTLLAEVGQVKFGVCAAENTHIFNCDVFVSDTQSRFVDCGLEVYFNNRIGTLNVFDCGDLIFKINDGNYRLVNTIPPKR